MGWFWIIFAVPFLIPFIAKAIWHTKITWVEMALQLVIVCGLVSAVWFSGLYSETSDTEVWNGQVVDKQKVRVSCEHSYQCNCVNVCSGSGSNYSCTQICQTCYDHSYDNDWRVFIKGLKYNYFNIRRVDRQGLSEPPRWTQVQIGDPVADTYGYTNWVKAVPESLFHDESNLAEKYKDQIPQYPLTVYDYQYLDRVLTVGVEVPDLKQWNRSLAEELRILGPTKQVNIVMVIVDTPDPLYAYGLKNAWLGGKKNDIVIVVGISTWPKISWAYVFSWSKMDIINVSLRDAIVNLGEMDRIKFMDILRNEVYNNYLRRPMAEFEYLKDEIDPPLWVIITGLFLGISLSIGLTWYFGQDGVNITFNRN